MRGGGRRIPSGSEKPAAVSQCRSPQRNRQRVPERPTGRLYKKLTWVAVVIVDASPGPPYRALPDSDVETRVVQAVPFLEPAVMTYDPHSFVDELLSQLPINRDTRWTAGGLGLDQASFDAVAQRVLALETCGSVDVMNMTRESNRLNAIRFVRLV